MSNPRLSPIVAELDTLPKDILFVIAAIDILAHEQLTFIERVKGEIEERGGENETGRRVVSKVFDKGFHGWLEREFRLQHILRLFIFSFCLGLVLLTRVLVPFGFKKDKEEAYGLAVEFLKETYAKYGWTYSASE
jgi:hypothetical protein